jgi:gliding motility-associated-like protein
LIVSDGAGCTTTLSANLSDPTGPTLNVTTQSVTCFGGSTGGATVTVSGTGSNTFTWTPAVFSVNTGSVSTVNGLIAGLYNVAVTNTATSCITTQSVLITQPSSVSVVSTTSNVKCFGSCDGSITVTASGGTPGYTYSWVPTTSVTGQGTPTVTNLCAGNYTVNITDANTCPNQFTFSITQPSAISLTTSLSDVKCNGACNGSINVTSSGGTGVVSYTWLPVGTFTGSLNSSVNNLCPAIYTLNAADANNCALTTTIQIIEPTLLTSTINITGATCSNSCNATATIIAQGGTPTYTYNWSANPTNTTNIGGLCSGNYTGTVTDANGCISSQSFTVTPPSQFNVTLTPTDPLCNAVCNGSISTILSGAQGTVNYVWTNSAVGQNPINLCAGVYSLQATDAIGCIASASVNLINPPALISNLSFTNPSCNGDCNGIAVSSPSNAVGLVTYSWSSSPINSPTLSALCAGNYTLNIQDANSCQSTQSFTLTDPALLVSNFTISPSTCGASNGSINVGTIGGTPSYTYNWSAPISSTNNLASGLAAGIYSVIVTDSKNCTNTLTIPLSNIGGPTLTPIVSTSINCNGQCTGAASINPSSISGGTPGYTVTWVPTATSPTSVNPLINLCAGSYTAQVIDANGCILFSSVVISEPSPITFTPNIKLPTCNGICNGSITLNVSGASPPYQYTWTPGTSSTATLLNACAGNYTINILDNQTCPSTLTVNLPGIQNITVTTSFTDNVCFGNCQGAASVVTVAGSTNTPINYTWSNLQNGLSATNLCNGVYTLTATDASGCFDNFTVNISSPAQITSTTTISSPSCGLCNGASSVIAGGGLSPYTYNWTSGSSTFSASNLCAGLYQVLITDANLCTQTQNILISNSSGITGEVINTQDESCFGSCNGSATVSPIGGTLPILFNWINPPTAPATSSVISNLCGGSYFIQMTDAQGCIRTSSLNINSATQLTLAPTVKPPTCALTNGSINITPSGGNPGYTFSWLPTSTSTASSLSGIGSGNYTVTVTDANGCQKTQGFSLSNLNSPVITYTQNNVACFGNCTGSINVVATSTAIPINYLWSNATTNNSITSLCQGIITLTVTDINSCKTVQNFSISQNPQLQLSLPILIQPKCFNDCNGSITLVPSGGVLPYNYSWSIPGTTISQFSLCPSVYSATVTDNNGCQISSISTVTNPTRIVLTPTTVNSSCSSISDGSLSINVSGGAPAYNFTWTSLPSFTSNSSGLSSTLNGILSGTYSLSLTDQNGCLRDTVLVVNPTIFINADAGGDFTVCPTPTVTLDGNNSVGAFSYAWFYLPNNTSTVANTASFVAQAPLTAPGTATYVLVATSSVSACFDSDTVIVNTYSLPFVDAGPSYTIPIYSNVTIGGNPTTSGSVSILWSPSFSISDPTSQNPIASNTINTVYTVTIIDLITGCKSSDSVLVSVYPVIKSNNGFTPNGDGKNDNWIIDNIDNFPDSEVEIYNRWGELLFYSKGYKTPFDGKYKGKDLPVGTYYYIIKLNHPAFEKPITGPLTIFR